VLRIELPDDRIEFSKSDDRISAEVEHGRRLVSRPIRRGAAESRFR